MEKTVTGNVPAITIQDLTVKQGQTPIITDFSATGQPGSKLVLQGASGSGKSTLLQALVGFIPFQGHIALFGQALTAATIPALRSRVAYLGQAAALGTEPVESYIRSILQARHNQALTAPYQQLKAHFERLRLPDRIWKQSAGDLSGGERQRVLLALAMALNRELYLLDEPTSALDPALQQEVISWLSNQSDATIVVAAHNQSWEAAGWQTLHMPSAYE